MVFCWYRGCFPRQILFETPVKILYVMRAINDAAIVWYEGVPKEGETPLDQMTAIERWTGLVEETGRTSASILQDLTGFYTIPESRTDADRA